MKYIVKLFLGSLLVGSSLMMPSCSEDYLNTAPTSSTGTEAAFATTASATAALNGIARIMSSQQYYFQGFCGENGVWQYFENYPDDNFYDNTYGTGFAVIFNMEWISRTNTMYSSYAWYYYYTIIGNANSIIANIDNAEGSDEEKAFIKASALTFRAYSYEKLARYYCERWIDSNNGASQGLVLRLDLSTGDLPYSTLAETFEQIYTDLDTAITLFTESGIDREAGDVWIPNINVAHAVYARAALGRQDFSTALSHAKDARNGYDLMSVEDYQSGFCQPTSEWIMGSYGGSDENNWYWSFGTSFAANGYYGAGTEYGCGQMNIELLNKIPNNDARKALFITQDKVANEISVSGTGLISDKNAAGDDDPAYLEVMDYVESMAVSGLAAPYEAGYVHLGGHLKFYVLDAPGVGYLPMIRSSEMVLVEAEANYFLGNTVAAQAALVELNATSGRNPGYTVSLTGDALWNEIMNYRGLEMWGEGTTLSDYKRWGRAIDRKGFADGGNAAAANAIRIEPDEANNWVWAIPEAETDYNGALTELEE